MAIKLADTLAPMADFPAALAEHIEFSDGENLQEKLDAGSLGSGGGASYKVVSSTGDMTEQKYIYLMSDGASSYNMYIVEDDGTATQIGNTTINLSNYFTKQEITDSYYDKATSDGKFASITTVDNHASDTVAHLTQAERDKLVTTDDIATSISDTPSDEKVASEKAVYNAIPTNIPTKVSELTNDSNFITGKMCMPIVLDIFENMSNYIDISTVARGVYLLSANDLNQNWNRWYVGILAKYDNSELSLTKIVSDNMDIELSGTNLVNTTSPWLYGLKLFNIGYNAY